MFKVPRVGLVGPDILRCDDFVKLEPLEWAGCGSRKGRPVHVRENEQSIVPREPPESVDCVGKSWPLAHRLSKCFGLFHRGRFNAQLDGELWINCRENLVIGHIRSPVLLSFLKLMIYL